MSIVKIERKILEKNDQIAAELRKNFQQKKIFTINLISSPGSGKTSLLEKTISRLNKELNIFIIEGDVQTDLDARRIDQYNVPVVQIITNGGCHLEANLIREALNSYSLDNVDLLIIENVGNLVCPAGYDLGENIKVVILSLTEGADKPLKYPAIFRNASVLIINKIDLEKYVDCSPAEIEKNALSVNPNLKIFTLSCTSEEGIEAWTDWLKTQVINVKTN